MILESDKNSLKNMKKTGATPKLSKQEWIEVDEWGNTPDINGKKKTHAVIVDHIQKKYGVLYDLKTIQRNFKRKDLSWSFSKKELIRKLPHYHENQIDLILSMKDHAIEKKHEWVLKFFKSKLNLEIENQQLPQSKQIPTDPIQHWMDLISAVRVLSEYLDKDICDRFEKITRENRPWYMNNTMEDTWEIYKKKFLPLSQYEDKTLDDLNAFEKFKVYWFALTGGIKNALVEGKEYLKREEKYRTEIATTEKQLISLIKEKIYSYGIATPTSLMGREDNHATWFEEFISRLPNQNKNSLAKQWKNEKPKPENYILWHVNIKMFESIK